MRLVLAALLATASLARAQDPENAPFITTPDAVVDRMLEIAGAGPGDLVVDLGSGDGRIVIEAARKFGARGLGIELNPLLVEKSRENARQAGVEARASFVEGDVLTADLSKASVVTVYLLPSLIGRLQPRFLDELRPGTRVVSHAFYMTSWKPDRVDRMRVAGDHPGQGDESVLYLWIVPAKARGEWRGGNWLLRIAQNYQQIDVEAQLDGKAVAVSEARLRGDRIEWRAQGVLYQGRIEGDRIVAGPLVLARAPR